MVVRAMLASRVAAAVAVVAAAVLLFQEIH
jgi:hypothetical protein